MTITSRLDGANFVITIPIDLLLQLSPSADSDIIAWVGTRPDGVTWTDTKRFWGKKAEKVRKTLHSAVLDGNLTCQRTRGGGSRYFAVTKPQETV